MNGVDIDGTEEELSSQILFKAVTDEVSQAFVHLSKKKGKKIVVAGVGGSVRCNPRVMTTLNVRSLMGLPFIN